MSSTGTNLRCDNERPPTVKSKKSFLRQLNEKHSRLSLYVRSKTGEQPAQQHNERFGRSRPLSPLQTEVSIPPLKISTSRFERNYSENELRCYDILEYSPIEAKHSSTAQPDSQFRLSSQDAVAQDERGRSRNSIQDIQDFMLQHRLRHGSISENTSYDSSLCSTQSFSRGSSNEMSDEQMEEWLERPEDAEAHRYRKLSGDSTELRDVSKVAEEVGKDTDVLEQQHEIESPYARR